MSYNPVSTNSRSNSPVPFGQGRPNQQQGYGQSSSLDASNQDSASPLTRHQRLLDQIPSRNPFQESSVASSSSSTASLSTFKNQNQHQRYPDHQQQQQQQQQQQHYTLEDTGPRPSFSSGFQPASPFAAAMRSQPQQHQSHGGVGIGSSASGTRTGASSTAGSYDGRLDNSSSHRSSAHNLALGHNDRSYNLTHSDSTLEALADRWQAYQAWWAKQYNEQPFYKIWTRSKWILLLSALLLLGYSAAAFGVSLGYILGHFEYAVVVMEFHSNLIYITLVGSIFGIICALVGLVGIFRENRILLSWYTVMLWPIFAIYLSVGYIAFRRAKNHLRAHLKDEWMHSYSREQRLIVQRNLKCCGYQDPTWYGEYDLRCFPMINLPGCQHKYNLYEDKLLSTCWSASFILVPFQLFVMIAALLCSNHVDGMLRSGRPGLKTFKEK